MTDAELTALELAAMRATPGPWVQAYEEVVTKDDKWVVRAGDGTGGCTDADAAYIASASPDKILELITDLRQAQANLKALESCYAADMRGY